ncbi:MAG: MGMT family protein [Acidobacteriota bacterium]
MRAGPAKPDAKLLRRILRDGMRPSEVREAAIRRAIRSIPRGRVATYGQVAAAAGYPLYHRLVVRILRHAGDALPWQRVVGAGGRIKLRGTAGLEQRLRLEMEGVAFRGRSVDLARHQHVFRLWEPG